MKKKLGLAALTLCSALMAGPALAQDLSYDWPEAYCGWAWGCRYTYQVPNPPAGKRWALELKSNRSVNDGNVWMRGSTGRVAMDRWGLGREHIYKGAMPTGGELEFWMPFIVYWPWNMDTYSKNWAYLKGTLVDANTPPEKRPW